MANLRYDCLTKEQQAYFDSMNVRQKRYVLLRSQGKGRAEAYKEAGFKSETTSAQNAYILETRLKPRIPELIEALSGRQSIMDALKEQTPFSVAIDEKVTYSIEPELECGLVKVDENAPVVKKPPLDPARFTYDQADTIRLYRQIANGTIKSVKITTVYDSENKVVKKTVEEASSIEDRIKAQREVLRLVGGSGYVEIDKVQANNINVMIVDASKKAKTDNPLDKLQEIDGEVVLVEENKEVKENGKGK